MIVKAGVIRNGRHDRWLTAYAAELLAASIGGTSTEPQERGDGRAGSLPDTSHPLTLAAMPEIDPARPAH